MTLDMQTAPKSDQLNYDDIPNGKSITITITRVTENADPQQPRSVWYEGDNGKPYKPGLSMRRALVEAFGDDGTKYVGKSMTLFGDPTVRFGPNAVGGIRISHASHLDKDLTFLLTVSKGIKKPYTIKQLKVDMGLLREEIDVDTKADNIKLRDSAREISKKGENDFKNYFKALEQTDRDILKPIMDELKQNTINAIPADPPPSQDEEAGTVESDVTAPQSTGSTTTIDPITDEKKHLSRNDIIKALSDCGTEDEVDTLITCQSLGIAKKSEGDQITISNAAIDRKKELSDG